MSKDKIIAITGSGRGIGAEISRELMRRGFTIAHLNRRGKLPALEQREQHHSSRMIPIACDVSSPRSIHAAMEQIAKREEEFVGLINNAGIMQNGSSDQFAIEDFETIFKTNLFGAFAACQAAFPYFKAGKKGLIINIGSFWDQIGAKNFAAYAASKAALSSITKTLAVEWAKNNIQLLNIAPGYIKTDMTETDLHDQTVEEKIIKKIPTGRLGIPQDIAKLTAALYIEHITFLTGTTIYIDGGQGIAP